MADPSPRALALWRLDLCRVALGDGQYDVLFHNAQELVKLAKKLSGGKGLRRKRRPTKEVVSFPGGETWGKMTEREIEELQ